VRQAPCAMCGVSPHRYGTTDPEHEYDAMACVNSLLGELERLRLILDGGPCGEPHLGLVRTYDLLAELLARADAGDYADYRPTDDPDYRSRIEGLVAEMKP
jgi:hypothetical protein